MKDRRKKGLSGLVLLSMLCTNVLPVYAQEAVLPEQPVAYTQAEELKAEDLVVKPLTDVLLGAKDEDFLAGLSIDGISLGEDGGKEVNPITGEIFEETAKALRIAIDYEGDDKDLYEIFKKLTGVNIDGIDYIMVDPGDNKPSFLFTNGSLTAWDKYETGKKAIANFEKQEAKNAGHKVILTFEGAKTIEYEDDGYIAPTPDEQPPAPPSPDQPPNPSEPGTPGPIEGIAKEYSITKIDLETQYGKELKIELNKRMSNQHLNGIKSMKVNDVFFNSKPSTLRLNYEDKLVISDLDAEIIKAAEKKNPIDIEIAFSDGSILKSSTGGTVQPPIPEKKIAEKYPITTLDVVKKEDFKGLKIGFEESMTIEDGRKITEISVDDTKASFKENTFETSDKKILVINEELFNAAKAKGQNPVSLVVTFKDGSKTEKSITPHLDIVEDTPNPPSNPDNPPQPPGNPPEQGETGKLAEKYKDIKNVEIGKTWSGAKEFRVSFEKGFEREDVKNISKIIVNGTEFIPNQGGISLGINFDKQLYELSGNAELIKKAEEKSPIGFVIVFQDGSSLTSNAQAPAPTPDVPTPQPPSAGIAGEYSIEDIRVSEEDTTKELKVDLNKEFAYFHRTMIIKLQVNGVDFDINESNVIAFNKLLRFKGDGIVEQAKKKSPIQLIITFKDGSQLKKNVVDTSLQPSLTLDSAFENGDYTLTFKTYVVGKNQTEESTLGHYFDVRAKLHVEGEKKTVSFLNHLYAELILDFAMQEDGKFVPLDKRILEEGRDGDAQKVEYSIELKDLKETKKVAVLGSGPMGGSPDNKGDYEGSYYKKAEIIFDNTVKQGWTDYKVVEDAKLAKEKNEEALIQGLIANNVDTNNDGKISKEELQNAKGRSKELAGFQLNNVIDLEGVRLSSKLTDISMLKDLGPHVKALNLDGNNIASLPPDIFKNATGLTHIFLGGNEIKVLDANTFSSLEKLKYIDFDGNFIETLPEGIFDNNKRLEVLSLMNMKLSSVPSGLIRNNSRLKEFYLSENKLNHLSDNFFEGQSGYNLKVVTLFSNNLDSLPSSLGAVKGLKEIRANHNRIKEIPDSFKNLQNIESIDLEDNDIAHVPAEFMTHLVKLSKTSKVRLDLTSNRLTNLPLEEMTQELNNGGGKLTKFEVNKNYLPVDLNPEQVEKHKALGIIFSDYADTYFPQKGNAKHKITASSAKIKLTQEFDILELYYWDMGDSAYFGGKEDFFTAEEFKEYLLGQGRDQNHVDRSLPRDIAIQKILNKKGIKWKIETVVTKNEGTEIFRKLAEENPVDGLTTTFEDSSMRKGDRYTFTKTLYVKGVLGWHRGLEYQIDFIASNDSELQPGEVKDLNVKLVQVGTDRPSVANGALNPNAKLVKEGSKFKYTLELKPLKMGLLEGNVTELSVFINGVKIKIEPETISGEYTKSYSFYLDEPVERVKVAFKVDAMPNAEPEAELVFSDKPSTPQPDGVRTVKAYILSADKKKPSMADGALVREVTLTPVDGGSMYDVAVEFKEMTIQGITSGVESFSIKTMGQKVPATKVEGKKGMFTFKLPKHLVLKPNSTRDTELNLEMTTYPKMPGHEKPYDVWMVLDWNGDFKFPDSNIKPPMPSPGDNSGSQEEYSVDVWMKSTDGGVSVGNKALSSTAKVVKNGSNYRYTIWLNPIDLDMNGKTLRGTITSFSVRGQEIEPNGNAYTFELDEKVNELEVSFVVDVMEELGVGSKDAYIVFNWDGSNSKPSGESPGPSFGGGGGAGPAAPVKPVLTPNQPAVTAEQALNKAAKILALPAQEKKYYSAKTLKKIEAALEAQKKGEEGALKQLETVLEEARIERITSILEEGYMTGYPNKEFKPNGTMSRAEASIMFAKLIEDEATKMEKTDIKDGVWYSDSVNKLASLGYLKAIEDGKYNPEGKITRAEYAFLLAKLRNLPVGNQSFGDVAKDHWASDAIAACKEAGIIVGYADGSFKPDGEITRAEAVVMIQSTFDVKAKEGLKEAFNDVPKDHWAYNAIMTASKK